MLKKQNQLTYKHHPAHHSVWGLSMLRSFGVWLFVVLVGVGFARCSSGSKSGQLCRTDSECGSGFFCDQGRCAGIVAQGEVAQDGGPSDETQGELSSSCPVNCKFDSDCSGCSGGFTACRTATSGKVCGLPSTTGCKSDSECGAGQRCEAGKCEAIPEKTGCTSNQDCQQGERCNNGTCESNDQTCTTKADCDNGKICLEGSCRQPPNQVCETSNDCARGERCVRGKCQDANAPCTVKRDCGSKQNCTNGTCQDSGTNNNNNNSNTNGNNNQTTSCKSSEDCPEGKYCNTNLGTCRPSVTSSSCTEQSDCGDTSCVHSGMGCKCLNTPEGMRCVANCLKDEDCQSVNGLTMKCHSTDKVCQPTRN